MKNDLGSGVTTLQDMFPISAHQKDEEIKSVTASYLRYKMEYVKHLAFNSSEENFSKFRAFRLLLDLLCSHFGEPRSA